MPGGDDGQGVLGGGGRVAEAEDMVEVAVREDDHIRKPGFVDCGGEEGPEVGAVVGSSHARVAQHDDAVAVSSRADLGVDVRVLALVGD